MSRHTFEVQPVAEYAEAHYPAAFCEETDEIDRLTPQKLLKFFALAVFSMMLALGLMACFDPFALERLEERYQRGDSDNGNGDSDNTGDDAEMMLGVSVCIPGEVYCSEALTLATCDMNGNFEYTDCAALCEEQGVAMGYWGYSAGCDAEAADPCQCQYDIVDGDVAQCLPGDVHCLDATMLGVCREDGLYDYFNCDERCVEIYGPGAGSLGCDPLATDPCQCEYDMMPGEAPVCYPGDIICPTDTTIGVCVDSYDYQVVTCDTYCQDTLGDPNATSTAPCDPESDDPCGCQ